MISSTKPSRPTVAGRLFSEGTAALSLALADAQISSRVFFMLGKFLTAKAQRAQRIKLNFLCAPGALLRFKLLLSASRAHCELPPPQRRPNRHRGRIMRA